MVQFPYSSAALRTVKEVQFGILSPDEIVSSGKRVTLIYLRQFY